MSHLCPAGHLSASISIVSPTGLEPATASLGNWCPFQWDIGDMACLPRLELGLQTSEVWGLSVDL
jgi:hypothetical protein